jgi:hypothetical protein
MRRSQPLDMTNEKLLKRLGIKEKTEEEKAAGREVVKVETVDEMFEFTYKDTIVKKILRPFRRLKLRYKNWRNRRKAISLFKEQLTDYYPWSIMSGLQLFSRHLELYIKLEKKAGRSTKECREYKISTAQETLDILKRIVAEDYDRQYLAAVEAKWGKFPYEKTTYANGDTSFKHLAPDEHHADSKAAYEKGHADEERDLKRLGELVTQNMMDWWD